MSNTTIIMIDKNIHTREGFIHEMKKRGVDSGEVNVMTNHVFDENSRIVLMRIQPEETDFYGIDSFDQIINQIELPDVLCKEMTQICALQLIKYNINIMNDIKYYTNVFKVIMSFLTSVCNINEAMSEEANNIINASFMFIHNMKILSENTINLEGKIVVSPVHC